jgi:glucokinase
MGVVKDDGVVIAEHAFPTPETRGPEEWLEAVARGKDELFEATGPLEQGMAGIGAGVPGFVDFGRGLIYNLPNVPGWRGVPMGKMLRERFDMPAFVDNDVNVMALGECTYGSGRAYEHAVFLTLGTGVGGGLLLDNKIYRGAYSLAGEIGHVSIDMNGIPSAQGRGGLEEYVGNRQIVARTVQGLEHGRESSIRDAVAGDLGKVTPKVIAEAARQGDTFAEEIFGFVADCVATVLASVTYLLQPQAFVVGGGVAQSGDVLFVPLRRRLKERLSPYFAENIEVMPAALGNAAGTIGAAALALHAKQ